MLECGSKQDVGAGLQVFIVCCYTYYYVKVALFLPKLVLLQSCIVNSKRLVVQVTSDSKRGLDKNWPFNP